MALLGKVSEWHDDRGFGFVAPIDAHTGHHPGAGDRVFFHIRHYDPGTRRPEVGELVRYSAAKLADGRWRASRIRRAVPPVRGKHSAAIAKRSAERAARKPAPAWMLVALVLVYAAGWAVAVRGDRLPMVSLVWLAVANLVTVACYYSDKAAARRGRSRIPESTLHALEFAGGWPGALLAQRLFRHKTTKASYRIAFWTMVTGHIAVVAGLAYGRALG